METYINIGNYAKLDTKVLQSRINRIAEFYNADNYIDSENLVLANYENKDIVIRVPSKFKYLSYATKDFYESNEWESAVNIISYNDWLFARLSKDLPDSDSEKEKEPRHYIYLLKDNLSFALETMSGDVADDYITLLDYSDIGEVNTYTASSFLNSVSSAFNMDKFYQIPVKNSDQATINDVFDFLKKEK